MLSKTVIYIQCPRHWIIFPLFLWNYQQFVPWRYKIWEIFQCFATTGRSGLLWPQSSATNVWYGFWYFSISEYYCCVLLMELKFNYCVRIKMTILWTCYTILPISIGCHIIFLSELSAFNFVLFFVFCLLVSIFLQKMSNGFRIPFLKFHLVKFKWHYRDGRQNFVDHFIWTFSQLSN